MENPKLIDPGVKYHLYNTLHKCHDARVNIYTWALNIGLFILFIVVGVCALYFCYTKKLTPEEKYNKMLKDQAYIMSKIRFYQNERVNMPLSSLTSLPIVKQSEF
jgi:hypothetical protein